jgi:Holliday junction DNA helicase RuvA
MAIPVSQMAAAIERGDEHTLTSLPDIGKKTAAQIIADLRGKVSEWTQEAAGVAGPVEMNEPQRLALDILVQWGDRRADAQRWIAAAVRADPQLDDPQQIVRAAYKLKQSA